MNGERPKVVQFSGTVASVIDTTFADAKNRGLYILGDTKGNGCSIITMRSGLQFAIASWFLPHIQLPIKYSAASLIGKHIVAGDNGAHSSVEKRYALAWL